MFADAAAPIEQLIRPVLAAAGLAIVIGALASLSPRWPVALSAFVAGALVVPVFTLPVAIVAVAATAMLAILRMRPRGADRALLILAVAWFAVAGVRAASVIDLSAPQVAAASSSGDAPIVLILLDGYPREDTLIDLGVDNGAFYSALEERGFDIYPTATSVHGWTHRTLQAMLVGSAEGIPDEAGPVDALRAVRQQLVAPDGWDLLDPPNGHTTLRGGNHLGPGGINEIETHLLAQSIIGKVLPGLGRQLIADALRSRLDRGLEILTTYDGPRMFAHLLTPHPPFLWNDVGEPIPIQQCWPDCQAFHAAIEQVPRTMNAWAAGMGNQLEALNPRLLAAIDSITDREPDAVIVLFSDHGARYSYRTRDEWHRSFLAARTPGNPELFANEPHPHAVLRLVEEAYP